MSRRRNHPVRPANYPDHLARIFACFPGSEIEGPQQVSKDRCIWLVGYPLRQLGLKHVQRHDGRVHTHLRTSVPFDRWGDGAGDALAGDPVPGPTDEQLAAARADLDNVLAAHRRIRAFYDPSDPDAVVSVAELVAPLPEEAP